MPKVAHVAELSSDQDAHGRACKVCSVVLKACAAANPDSCDGVLHVVDEVAGGHVLLGAADQKR